MTLWSKWVEDNKGKVLGAYFILGLLTFFLSVNADQRNRDTEAERDNVVAKLDDSVQEQNRLSERNSALQQETLALSKENRELSNELLQRTRGDPNNPPYLYFFEFVLNKSPPLVRPYLVNSSAEYAAREVTVSMELGGSLFTSEAYSLPPSNGFIGRASVTVPNTAGRDSRSIGLPAIQQVGRKTVIPSLLVSSAGSYRQITALIRQSDTVVLQAARVYRDQDRSNPIFARSDPGFPDDFDWPTPEFPGLP